MAILGYDTKDTASGTFLTDGRLFTSKFTLATAATLTELHAWFKGYSPDTVRVVIYADNGSGAPGARVAYTNSIALTGSGLDQEVSQSGLSVSLPAGDYWIGAYGISIPSASTKLYGSASGASYAGRDSASNPPPDPFGTATFTGTRKHSAWAVVGSAAAAFVPQITIT